jgi:transcriptional regulator with XRE-family HTH domain
MIDAAFATVLRRVRQQKNISQEDLALVAGLHRTYISQLERRLKSPTIRTIYQITQALGISLADFMLAVQQEVDAHAAAE